MKVYVCYDKPSKTWYARWRSVVDGKKKLNNVRLMHRSDRYHSKADVRKSPEFKAIARQVGDGLTDPKQAKLLLAVAEARGKARPDAADTALVERVVSEDSAANMMLGDFVDQVYFPFAEASLRAKTVKEYHGIWKRNGMAEKTAGLRVSDFRTKHGAAILESITARDVSKTTLQHAKFFLSAVFVLATNKGLCDSNPMEHVLLPKARGSRETYAYDLDEILATLNLPFEAKVKAAIGVAAFAALRESEIAGLHWDDYDGDSITVRRSIDRVNGTPNPPKTIKSAAPVPVVPTLKRLLDAYKATTLGEGAMFPGVRQTYADLDKMAFAGDPTGSGRGGAEVGWMARIQTRGGFEPVFQLGVDELTVQRILRHSKATVTRERYIKVKDERAEQAMATFEAAIASKNEEL